MNGLIDARDIFTQFPHAMHHGVGYVQALIVTEEINSEYRDCVGNTIIYPTQLKHDEIKWSRG